MRRRITAALMFLCLVLAAGCGGREDGVKGQWQKPVETRFLTFTAISAFWDNAEGEPPPEAPDGKRYLWVQVEIQNTSGSSLTLYYDEFELYIDGEPRFPERAFSGGQLAEEQVLKDQDGVSGYLVFLVPEDAKKLQLAYEEYFQGDSPGERYIVNISKKNIQSI